MSAYPTLVHGWVARVERAVAPVERYELFTGDRSDRSLLLYERAGYRRVRTVRESDRLSLTFLEKAVADRRPL